MGFAGEYLSYLAGFDSVKILSGKIVDFHGFYCGKNCERFPNIEWVNNPSYFDENENFLVGGISYPKVKQPGEKRVLFIGDSGTYGLGVKREDRFTSILQKNFDDNWSMINAGIPGFDNVDELFHLRTNLHKLSPDYVIWQIFMANDLNMNISMVVRESHKKGFLIRNFSNSSLFKLLYTATVALGLDSIFYEKRDPEEKNFTTSVRPVDHRGLNFFKFPEGEYALYHKSASSLEPLVHETFKKIALEIKEFCVEIGSPLFVVIIPTRSNIENDLSILPDLPEAKTYFGQSEFFYRTQLDYSRPHRFVRKTLESFNIPYYDPMDSNVGSWFLLDQDDHPSPKGHSLIGKEVELFLRAAP